ncbi:hypothetical protein GCM10009844_30640 [Nocardioides koreensis]|uniref:DUF1707 domain-containing protein n=1 Tax=Nocardioides koreensis TaxID=433651 RepID=A0ABN2ZYC4_9ACTN
MSDQHLRLSDAERDRAATELAEHYAQGRLTPEEHGDRLDRIWAARTRGELTPVFRDLPGSAYAPAPLRGLWPAAPPAPRPRGLPGPLIALLVVLLVITVLTHIPIILIGLLVWFFVVPRLRRRTTVRRW